MLALLTTSRAVWNQFRASRHRDVVPVTAPMQPNSLVDSTQVEGNIEELRGLRQAADPTFPAGAVRQAAPLP